MAPPRKPPRKKAKKRKPRRTKPAPSGSKKKGRTVEELVRLQQKSAGQMARLWANAADRAAKGDFSVTQWLTDYTDMWGELAADYGNALRAMFPKKSSRKK
jgi:hypothetical protein